MSGGKLRADLACEDPALAHADVDWAAGAPASTTARTVRSSRSSSSPNVCGAPRDEDDLPARLDRCRSRGTSRRAPQRRTWDRANESVQRGCGGGLGSFSLQSTPSGASEADERDGCISVLALERPYFEQLRAERRGNGDLESDALEVREGLHRASHLGRGPGGAARAPRSSADRLLSEKSEAVASLTRISPASDSASISTVRVALGPVTRSSRSETPDEKELKSSRSGGRRASSSWIAPADVFGRPIAGSLPRPHFERSPCRARERDRRRS